MENRDAKALMSALRLSLQRPFVYVLVVSMVTTIVALACQHCLAAIAWDGPVPAQGSSGNCHPESQGTPDDPAACKCPSFEPAGHAAWDMAIASTRPDTGHDQPPAVPASPARGAVLIAGGLSPGGLPAVPRLPPIRRFCVQLE